jgi:hypothetical protein
VTLGFLHDGLGTLELYANGQTVARRTGVYAGVNPVGPGGVAIGNSVPSGTGLSGQLDETRIWRRDP